MAGEVVRAKNRHDAMRAMAQYRTTTGCLGFRLTGAVMVCLNGNIDLTDHGSDFGTGLPQGFSRLSANQAGQLFLVGFQLFAKGFHHGLAFREAFPAPSRKRPLRLPDSRIHIFQIGGITVPDHIAGNRVQGFKHRVVSLQPEAVNIDISAKGMAHTYLLGP